MAVFAVTYHYVDDPDALGQHRPAHRQYLGSLLGERGLRAAGPTSGGAGATARQSFDAESPDAVEALLDEDPFWIEGLITAREILEWNVVLGSVGSSSGH
jgi:uncharacterized protein YciI